VSKEGEGRCEEVAAKHQPTPSEEETTSDCDSVMDAVSQEPEPEPSPAPPSTDDGFQTVPQKRKRKEQTSATQDPTPKKVSGNPPTGTNWRRTAPVPPAPQTQPQERDPEPARKPRVPPVIIRDYGKWTEVSKLLSYAKIHFTKARQCAEGIGVQFAGSNEFRAATRLLETLLRVTLLIHSVIGLVGVVISGGARTGTASAPVILTSTGFAQKRTGLDRQ
jgi:hypothetical protein